MAGKEDRPFTRERSWKVICDPDVRDKPRQAVDNVSMPMRRKGAYNPRTRRLRRPRMKLSRRSSASSSLVSLLNGHSRGVATGVPVLSSMIAYEVVSTQPTRSYLFTSPGQLPTGVVAHTTRNRWYALWH